jgi:hypothetical protein
VHTVLSCRAVEYEAHNQYAYYNHQKPENNISFSQFKSKAQYYNHGRRYLKIFPAKKIKNTALLRQINNQVPQLSSQRTQQKIWNLNGRPTICMFLQLLWF